MYRLTALLLIATLAACAHAPTPDATPAPGSPPAENWTYLGNDADGTQNISMQAEGTDKRTGIVTTLYKFEFTGPHTLTGPNLKTFSYIERRDLTAVDCKAQTLKLIDESYLDVDGHPVFHVTPSGDAADANKVFAGGVSDIMYEGSCGKTLEWTALGQDPQKTQDIFARVPNAAGQQDAIVKASFRFVYHDERQMVASPSLKTVDYLTRQASVMMDCGNQTFTVLHETYYDTDDVTVFGITPPKGAHPDVVAPDSITGIMYRAACGIPLNWTLLGMDPRKTQKIYLIGAPEQHSGGTVEARYRIEYLAPGKLTVGGKLQQVEYTTRTNDLLFDCAANTLTLLRESYQDADRKEVFSVKPATPQAVAVAPQGPSGMMQKAACHP